MIDFRYLVGYIKSYEFCRVTHRNRFVVTQENEAEEINTSTNWPIERATGLLAGTIILLSLGMGRLHSGRWRILTAFVGSNLLLNAIAGWCPASLIMKRLGVPTAAQCSRR